MSGPIIHLFFSGFLAFQEPSQGMMNVYVVDDKAEGDCDHIPSLLIVGNADITQGQGSVCDKDPAKHKIYCKLTSDTVIDLTTEPGSMWLPKQPPGNSPFLPTSNKVDDGGNIGWLVRMSNVEGPAAPLVSDLHSRLDGEMSFGWQNAYTCLFDVDSKKMVHPMEFTSAGISSTHAQAVAEVVMFEAKLKNSAQLTLKSGRSVIATIGMDCTSGVCPLVWISNDVGDNCPPSTHDHFDMYYARLSADQNVKKLHPDRINKKIDEKTVTFSCPEMIKPEIGGHGEKRKNNIQASRVVKALRMAAVKLLRAHSRKPANIIICPPVVMGQ
jgi:hypothetical protein